MEKDIFADYKTEQRPSKELLKKYRDLLPKELLEIWEKYGFGSIMEGYLRFINPDDYMQLIKDTYFDGSISIPICSTAFGDIITFEEGDYIIIVQYKKGTFHVMIRTFDLFIRLLEDEDFLKDFFDIEKYQEALTLLAPPKIDECFGYTPLLALGGSDKVENLQVVKMREHVFLISQVIGRIGE